MSSRMSCHGEADTVQVHDVARPVGSVNESAVVAGPPQ